jgi:two-component system sensor histidine kinase MprB
MKSLAGSREQQKNLIADAGHELRTPLTSMRTNVELLVTDDKVGMLKPEDRTQILTDVSEQLAELSALVGDLVLLSRDDKLAARREELELKSVVESAITRVRRRALGLEFDVHLDGGYVIGDGDALERAVLNLLDNAVKFSPPGGTIHVTLAGTRVTVRDEGPGVPEEDLPHIFDRFYRSDKARNTPGTGLGLAIVAHTATSHGGSVSVTNSPEGGAVFTLDFPPAPEPEAE